MKKIILILLCVCSVSVFAQDKQFNWKTNLEDAKVAAKDGDKPILVFFTNHQDSESLKMLQSNFFGSPEFKTLSNNMVLLFVDASGRDKNMTDLDKNKNLRLVIHYNKSNSFPSLIAIDKNGRVLGEHFKDISATSITNYLSFLNTL
jgi:thioredoxin-related protein